MKFFTREQKNIDEISPENLPEGLAIASSGMSEFSVDVPPYTAYMLAKKNNDLGKVIADISEDVAALKIGIQTAPRAAVQYTHPVLSILQNPGGGLSRFQFIRALSESFLLTAMAFFVIRGRIDAPALDLVFLFPWEITYTVSQIDGQPLSFLTTGAKDRRTYARKIDGNRYRYIDEAGVNELVVIRGALSPFDGWSGSGRLAELLYDLEISNTGKRHNTSLLRNGMRTSAIISPDVKGSTDSRPKWGPELVQSIAQKLRFFHQGAGNAGNVLVLGTPAKTQGMSQNNVEMDFIQLLSNSQKAVYLTYKYPLPLVLAETMTLDNYTVAVQNYYTDAVYPVFEALASGLMQIFQKRYDIPPGAIFTFSEIDIRAMQGVIITRAKDLNAMNVFTKDEVRQLLGYVPVSHGDEIYVPGNVLPLSALTTVTEFTENIETPDDEEGDENE